MKKIIKVTPKQLQKLIQEEAVRQKRILDLKSKREDIVNQLNEMYENDEYMDEGIKDFFLGSKDKWKQKFLEWFRKNKEYYGKSDMEAPEPMGQDLEDIATAAQKFGDFRLIKHNGQWVPTHHVSSGVGNAMDGSGRA